VDEGTPKTRETSTLHPQKINQLKGKGAAPGDTDDVDPVTVYETINIDTKPFKPTGGAAPVVGRPGKSFLLSTTLGDSDPKGSYEEGAIWLSG